MNDSSATGASRMGASELRRIDALCNEFEGIQARGESATIEDFLPRVDERLRPVLLEFLLLAEIDIGGATKFQSAIDSIRERFPAYRAVVDGVFAMLGGSASSATHKEDATTLLSVREVAPLPTPQTIDRFCIEAELGHGAFGTVYRAFDPFLQRIVALKVPLTEVTSEADKRRLRREAESAAQLHHPHIVPLYDAGEADGFFWISSALIDGHSLRHVLTAGRRFSTSEAVALVIKLADALDYAHRRGVVHRDVNPNNILIDAAGDPYLVDFGLAFRLTGDADSEVSQEPQAPNRALQSQAGKMVGTPAYMSPEQAAGRIDEIGGRSDVWGLGVVLYELLSRRLPFGGGPSYLVPLKICFVEPLPLREAAKQVPRDLHAVCHKCLEKDPSRRFQTGDELAEELRRWTRGELVKSRRIGLVERLVRLCRRHPLTSSLAATAILLVAATIGAITYGYHQTSAALAEADVQRSEAETQRSEAEAQRTQAETARAEAETQRTAAVDRGLQLERQKKELDEELFVTERKSYTQLIDLTRQYLENGRSELAWATLCRCREELRGWEFRYLEDRVRRELGATLDPGEDTRALAMSSNGQSVAYMLEKGTVEIARADTGVIVQTLTTFDFGEILHPKIRGLLAFDEEDRRLIGCLGKVGVIWSLADGQVEASWTVPDVITAVALQTGENGLIVVVGDAQGSIHHVDVARKSRYVLRPPVKPKPPVKFENVVLTDNPEIRSIVVDGRENRIAAQVTECEVEFWNLDSGKRQSVTTLERKVVAQAFYLDGWYCLLADGRLMILKDSSLETAADLADCLSPDEWKAMESDFLAAFDHSGDRFFTTGLHLFVSDKGSSLHVIAVNPFTGNRLKSLHRLAVSGFTKALAPSRRSSEPTLALSKIVYDKKDLTELKIDQQRIEVRRATRETQLATSDLTKDEVNEARTRLRIRLSRDGRFAALPNGQVVDGFGIREPFYVGALAQNEPDDDLLKLDEARMQRNAGWGNVQVEGIRFDDRPTTYQYFKHDDPIAFRFTAPDGRTSISFRSSDKAWLLERRGTEDQAVVIDLKGREGVTKVTANAITFSPDGKWFVVRGIINYLWSVSAGRSVGNFAGSFKDNYDLPLVFTPDSRQIAYATDNGDIALVDCGHGRLDEDTEIPFYAAHSGRAVCGIAFLPDQSRMVTTGADGELKLWDVDTRQLAATMPGAFVSWPAVSSDGSTIAALDANGNVHPFRAPPDRKLAHSPKYDVNSAVLAATSDGTAVFGGDEGLYHWSIGTKELRKSVSFNRESNSDWVVSAAGNTACRVHYRVEANSFDVIADVAGEHPTSYTASLPDGEQSFAVAVAPSGQFIAVGTLANNILVWDVVNRKIVADQKCREGVVSLAFSDDGRELLVNSLDSIERRDAKTLDVKHTVSTDWRGVSPHNRWMITSHYGRRLIRRTSRGFEVRNATSLAVECFILDADRPTSLALSHDDRFLAAGYEDGTIRLWHAATMRIVERWSAHDTEVRRLRFFSDGRLASSASMGVAVWKTIESDVKLRRPWHELALPEQIERLESPSTIPQHFSANSGAILQVAADGSGSCFATIDVKGKVVVWNRERPIRSVAEFDCGPVSHLPLMTLSRNAARLAVGPDHKGDVLIADSKSGRILRRISAPRASRFQLSSDGNTLVVASDLADYDGVQRSGPLSFRLEAWNTANGQSMWSTEERESASLEVQFDEQDRYLFATWQVTSKDAPIKHRFARYDVASGAKSDIDLKAPIIFPPRKPARYERATFRLALWQRDAAGIFSTFLDANEFQQICDLHPDGRHVLVAHEGGMGALSELSIYDLVTGGRVWSLVMEGKCSPYLVEGFQNAGKFTGDGTAIIMGDVDGLVRMWDVPVHVLHPGNISPEEEAEYEKTLPPAPPEVDDSLLSKVTSGHRLLFRTFKAEAWNACYAAIDLAAADSKAAVARLDQAAVPFEFPEFSHGEGEEMRRMLRYVREQILSLDRAAARLDPAVAAQLLKKLKEIKGADAADSPAIQAPAPANPFAPPPAPPPVYNPSAAPKTDPPAKPPSGKEPPPAADPFAPPVPVPAVPVAKPTPQATPSASKPSATKPSAAVPVGSKASP
jgi:WD40 repeat protein